jgi:hypothetical protein
MDRKWDDVLPSGNVNKLFKYYNNYKTKPNFDSEDKKNYVDKKL